MTWWQGQNRCWISTPRPDHQSQALQASYQDCGGRDNGDGTRYLFFPINTIHWCQKRNAPHLTHYIFLIIYNALQDLCSKGTSIIGPKFVPRGVSLSSMRDWIPKRGIETTTATQGDQLYISLLSTHSVWSRSDDRAQSGIKSTLTL